MGFAGLRGTDNWGTDERPKNFREMILWSNPNGMSPLTALLAKAKKQSVDDPEFSWFEEKLDNVRVSVNYGTDYVSTDNTIVIDADGLLLLPGDLLQVEKTETTSYDNELLEVSSITSDTTVVVKRGAANTTAAALVDNAYLTKIGNAFEEGTGGPSYASRNPTKVRNYTQIFKTGVGISRTAEMTRARTGDAFVNDKKRKAFDHAVSIEMAFLFGVAYEDTSGAKPKRTTAGLRSLFTTNVTVWATTPTEDTWIDAIYKVFDRSVGTAGDQRIMLCGNGYLNTLNRIVRDSANTQIRYDGIIKLYGMNLQRWILPQGELAIKSHPLMNQHGRYTNSAFILSPAGLYYRPLKGSDTRFKDNTQARDEDSREGIWLTEAGLEVEHEDTMAYHGNFVK